MEKAGKVVLVLCVYLTILMSSIEAQSTPCANCTTATANSSMETGTTPPAATRPNPDHSSPHVTPHGNISSTPTPRPHHSSSASVVSTTSMAVTASSKHHTKPSGSTHTPNATKFTTHYSTVGHAGSHPTTIEATTAKGGSSSLFRSCSQLLVPIISILIFSA
ncbi:mucin-5B-like [Scomber scombrus]|uniref:mucin-5B-like n=1 Tax=Scomber scombrus TaxID=13677 RepID=UPI002DDBC2AF|nr:mucin-5B-like [Scomber scombrus]